MVLDTVVMEDAVALKLGTNVILVAALEVNE
jgi:hypothetical protein